MSGAFTPELERCEIVAAAAPIPAFADGKRSTSLGTPCSPAWDDAHIAKVEAAEAQLNRRVCGARNLAGQPCALEPDHSNGRCRFHGGFDLTGAQPGNRNGVIHGLYARSIQTCGDHCAMWKTCPCANTDVMQLDPRVRPQCPYETVQYETTLTDALSRVDTVPRADEMTRHAAHHVAMLQVMVLRAAAAMSVNPLADATVVTAKDYRKSERRISVYTEAFLRLSAELRRAARQLESERSETLDAPKRHTYAERRTMDTSLVPEERAQIHSEQTGVRRRAYRTLRSAVHELRCGSKKKAKELLDNAVALCPGYVHRVLDPAHEYWDGDFELLLPFANAP